MFMMSRVGLGASRVASVVKSLLSLVAVDELFVFPFFMWTKITRLILIFYPFVCLVAPSLGATLEFFFFNLLARKCNCHAGVISGRGNLSGFILRKSPRLFLHLSLTLIFFFFLFFFEFFV